MKKGTVIGILLSVISIIGLGTLAGYLTLQFKDELFSAELSSTFDQAESAMMALYETETETEAQTERLTELMDVGTDSGAPAYIWVGDSRTLGMRDAMDNGDVYIGESGEGYNWLSETGLPMIVEAIAQYPELPIIFNFGVNDYDSLDNYMILYQALEEEYPDTSFYYLSINPIEPTLCDNITNEEIADFNQHLKELSPDGYIDSFTFIMMEEIVTHDGVHYSEEDYCRIYEYAAAQVDRKEGNK